jgi:fatty acid desaturase
VKAFDPRECPIPERLNVAILLVAAPATWGLLYIGSHAPWPWACAAAVLFAFVDFTPFSLMHEAVHGVFSANERRNEAFGVLTAAMFPTSFTLQRTAHLGHHRRNRTDRELYDYYLPSQSKALRNFWLYAGNLLGLYWFCVPFSTFVYFAAPWLYASRAFVEGPARTLGFGEYVEDIARQPKLRIWAECALALAYQAALWLALGLNWRGWLLCHWAFALHWSALQYVDHAWSPRDVVDGAWNLKASAFARLTALNYHDHLAHHRWPQVPWNRLPEFVDPAEPRPSFWAIYRSLWGGVRPAPPMRGLGAPLGLAPLEQGRQ